MEKQDLMENKVKKGGWALQVFMDLLAMLALKVTREKVVQ